MITIADAWAHTLVRLCSSDGINRLTRAVIAELLREVEHLAAQLSPKPLIITGNDRFFSAGADLNEIAQLSGAIAHEFSRFGQQLTDAVAAYPARTIAAISGYCMGGGIDLVLACDMRIAAPNAQFGHRGAALGILTGWGGTQRLPRLIGKARALQMFCAAEFIDANEALRIGLIDAIDDDPCTAATKLTAQQEQI